MINYTEKGYAMHVALRSAGHWIAQQNGVWVSDNDVAVQAFIDSYDPLPDYKAQALAAIKANGLARVQVIFPAITDVDTLKLVTDIMASILPAAKSLTANMTKAGQIYTAAQNGITAVNAAVNKAGVDAAVAAISWPA